MFFKNWESSHVMSKIEKAKIKVADPLDRLYENLIGRIFTVLDAVIPAPVHNGTTTLEALPGQGWSVIPSQNKAVKDLIRTAIVESFQEYTKSK